MMKRRLSCGENSGSDLNKRSCANPINLLEIESCVLPIRQAMRYLEEGEFPRASASLDLVMDRLPADWVAARVRVNLERARAALRPGEPERGSAVLSHALQMITLQSSQPSAVVTAAALAVEFARAKFIAAGAYLILARHGVPPSLRAAVGVLDWSDLASGATVDMISAAEAASSEAASLAIRTDLAQELMRLLSNPQCPEIWRQRLAQTASEVASCVLSKMTSVPNLAPYTPEGSLPIGSGRGWFLVQAVSILGRAQLAAGLWAEGLTTLQSLGEAERMVDVQYDGPQIKPRATYADAPGRMGLASALIHRAENSASVEANGLLSLAVAQLEECMAQSPWNAPLKRLLSKASCARDSQKYVLWQQQRQFF